MSERVRFQLTRTDGQDMTPEILAFEEFIGLNRAAPGRYSMLLVLGLFGGMKSGRQDPAKIIHEINALEGRGGTSQTKPPTQFNEEPLKGLWHKHYLQDGLSSMAMNLKKGLNKYGLPLFDQRVQEAQAAGEERFVSEADIPSLASDLVGGNWSRLIADQALTGEWIVYAQHEGKNYYLALGFHKDRPHDQLRRAIESVCCQEFPFLWDILTTA